MTLHRNLSYCHGPVSIYDEDWILHSCVRARPGKYQSAYHGFKFHLSVCGPSSPSTLLSIAAAVTTSTDSLLCGWAVILHYQMHLFDPSHKLLGKQTQRALEASDLHGRKIANPSLNGPKPCLHSTGGFPFPQCHPRTCLCPRQNSYPKGLFPITH